MIRRTLQLFLYDVRFQFRHGFYAIYLIISAIYIGILISIPEAQRLLVTNALVFSDTSVLGLTFIGAILLLEKQQNILQSLFVTPVRLAEYVIAKILSLSLIALLASLIILILPNGIRPSIGYFILGVLLSSGIFILIGLAVGARVTSLNGYLFGVMAGTIFFALPLLDYLQVYNSWWLYLLPSHAQLVLLSGTHDELGVARALFSILVLALWFIAAWFLAVRSFTTFIVRGKK